jgi:SAM-dependent methyltransferase
MINAGAEYIPYKLGIFDCVYANHVWEHLIDPIIATTEAYRVLNDNGIFYFELPNQFDNIMFKRDIFLKRIHQRNRNMYSIHHYFFLKEINYYVTFKYRIHKNINKKQV